MPYLRNLCFLLMAFLCFDPVNLALSYEITLERGYTTSVFNLPEKCHDSEFEKSCSRFVRFYSSRFEREFIVERNKILQQFEQDEENFTMPNISFGMQNVTLDLRRIYKPDVLLMSAYIERELNGEVQRSYETMNIDAKTDRPLQFKDFFDDPQLAAMICARAFDKKFARFHMPLFDTVSSSIESQPWNYTLYPDGIEFVFLPGTVTPDKEPAKLFVHVRQLKDAGVKMYFFPKQD